MKQELLEKTNLLREANAALDSIEQLRDRERTDYESQIESLRMEKDSLLSSIAVGNSQQQLMMMPEEEEENSLASELAQQQQIPSQDEADVSFSNVEVGDRSRALLLDAFGSMNLGRPDGGDLLGKIEELQREVQQKEEEVREMQEAVEVAQGEAAEKAAELAKESAAVNKLTQEFQSRVAELQARTEEEEEKAATLETQLIKFQEELGNKAVDGGKITALEAQVAELESLLLFKDARLTEAEEQLTNFKDLLATSQEIERKRVSAVQNASRENERLEKEVKVREEALAKMHEEYERVKAIVRRYVYYSFKLTSF